MGCNSSKASVGPVMGEETGPEEEPGREEADHEEEGHEEAGRAVRNCKRCRTKVDEDGKDLPVVTKPREEREVPEGVESGDHEELIGESPGHRKFLNKRGSFCLLSYVIKIYFLFGVN